MNITGEPIQQIITKKGYRLVLEHHEMILIARALDFFARKGALESADQAMRTACRNYSREIIEKLEEQN